MATIMMMTTEMTANLAYITVFQLMTFKWSKCETGECTLKTWTLGAH